MVIYEVKKVIRKVGIYMPIDLLFAVWDWLYSFELVFKIVWWVFGIAYIKDAGNAYI